MTGAESFTVHASAGIKAKPLTMSEDEFRCFFAETAGALRRYLRRVCGDPAWTEDLMQESYFRVLRAGLHDLDARQKRNYLFRIATNLIRDHFRRPRRETAELTEPHGGADRATASEHRLDVGRVLAMVSERERELVWLAYAEGASHREIAEITGVKVASVRPLLYRARRKLAALLRESGFTGGRK